MKGFFLLGLFISPMALCQKSPNDSVKTTEIEAVQFTRRLPVAKTIIQVEKDLGSKNLGQDLPFLLKNQMSTLSTSDAGNGIGYSGFSIRGVSGRGINVMLNGVPYNDSESQGTFFVNVPDLTSSASQIVIQRGVGTSSNGVSAFGASVNVISKEPSNQFYLKSDNSIGSFNTFKWSGEVGSGSFWKDQLSVLARVSSIHSDGYIDRAFSDLFSYSTMVLYQKEQTKIRAMAFGGKEKTYQAWNGIDKRTWETNPTFNSAGELYNEQGEIVDFYKNETDNYRQNHYQLLWEQNFRNHWKLETTLHYTKGSGYYENYKQDAKFSKYNLPSMFSGNTEITKTDFIRKKWLDNHFYGAVATLYGKWEALDINAGVVANQYLGDHFGRVSSVFYPTINEHEYYRNKSTKNEKSGFAKALYKYNDFDFFVDFQLRAIDYTTKILQNGDNEGGDINKNWLFFNPKAGVNFKLNKGKVYFSYAMAQREPNRDDLLENRSIQAEKLHDFEVGIEKKTGPIDWTANYYYMYFIDQLVLTGALNDVGAYIRTNSGISYRTGIELGASARVSKTLQMSGNLTLSQNKNKNYTIEEGTLLKNLGNTEISFSPRFISSLSVQYQLNKQWMFSITPQWVGSQFLDNTQQNELKIPSYVLADFNAKYQFKVKNNNFNVTLLVNNLFNRKYVNNGSVWGGEAYYFPQAGRNILMGVHWDFSK